MRVRRKESIVCLGTKNGNWEPCWGSGTGYGEEVLCVHVRFLTAWTSVEGVRFE